jgi:alkylation response protein AidB-like acyl-CoA dehydrogenase
MTAPAAPAAKPAPAAVPDAPLFDPKAFRLTDEQAGIMSRARHLGQTVFAGRAATYDREARFPVENYKDLHEAGRSASPSRRSWAGSAPTTRPTR